ncbi:MAG: hypothetical protein C5B53_08995 [Candidatus Melainabacteria bacterium]|nr:MAG: hypothetical protein C5B53_08995 [Candidatus Melainabacteria bacterium]
MTKAGISCAICTLNSSTRIEKCLEYLATNAGAAIPWEVVIVDNGSTDGTARVAETFWKLFDKIDLRIVSEPQPNIRQARLKAIESSRYSYVSFVDDDNWVPANWVETVFGIMECNPDAAALGVATRASFDVQPPPWFPRQQFRLAIGEQVFREQGWLWSAGLTLRKAAVQHILDTGFIFTETEGFAGRRPGSDVELTLFLTLAGWKLLYTNDLVLEHHIANARTNITSIKNLARAQGMVHAFLEPLIEAARPPRLWERAGLAWEHGLVWGALRLSQFSLRNLLPSSAHSDLANIEFWRGYLSVMQESRRQYITRIADARHFAARAKATLPRYMRR